MYLSKLGMIESGQATQYLTSMLKGFKLEANDAMDIVSKLTKVDMENAVSSGGLAEAISQTAVSAQMAGVSLDSLIGYATEIISTSQAEDSRVGNALKSVFARYGNVKPGAFSKMELSDESGETTQGINDIEKVLNKIGIKMRDTTMDFRDFDDVLGDIAEKWKNLDEVSRNAIATALGGKKIKSLVPQHIVIYGQAV